MENKTVLGFISNPNLPSNKSGNWSTHKNEVRTVLYFKWYRVATFYTYASPIYISEYRLCELGHSSPTSNTINKVQRLIKNKYLTNIKELQCA